MKTRNIIDEHGNKFAVAVHIITKGFWEFYLEEPDEHGITFGYVMGIENEWGSVDMEEIKPYITIKTTGKKLNEIMPPDGMEWEGEEV